MSKSSYSRVTFIAVAGTALAVGLAFSLFQFRQPPPSPPQVQQATWLPGARPIKDFELTDHTGAAFTNTRLQGHWSFIFFGYTHCPDVCPTTLAMLSSAAKKISAASVSTPQYVFVSVDPARDSTEQLAGFVSYFNKEFIGATGTLEAITSFTRDLGILYILGEKSEQGGYLVDHSASIMLLNPAGDLAAVFSPPHNPQIIATDFLELNRYYEEKQQ